MAIRPIDLPSAAGLEYGHGDVRHFAQGDAMDVPGVSNPTRHLAERDNQLAEKLNEVVGIVNNTEQFVPMPVLRTVLPPAEEVVVYNYRIPPGYESRVLNAAVASTPSSTDIEINIYYALGFGNVSGTNIVSASSEYTGGVNFYQTGEFIITLKNKTAATVEMTGSVLLTLRPLGASGSLLVGSIVAGPPGLPGLTGPPGPAGTSGSGSTGSPGMVWAGPWAAGSGWAKDEVVSQTIAGSTSAYICLITHAAPSPSPAVTPATWALVCQGAPGATGATGGGNQPLYRTVPVSGTLTTGADWSSNDIDDYLKTSSSTVYYSQLLEHRSYSTVVSAGTLAALFGSVRLNACGSGTITLPKLAYGAAGDWDNSAVQVVPVPHGTIPVETIGAVDQTRMVTVVPTSTDKWTFKILSGTPVRVDLSIFGMGKFS